MTTPTTVVQPAPAAQFNPIPFSRLLRAEWRKTTGTRAARWLLAAAAIITIGGWKSRCCSPMTSPSLARPT